MWWCEFVILFGSFLQYIEWVLQNRGCIQKHDNKPWVVIRGIILGRAGFSPPLILKTSVFLVKLLSFISSILDAVTDYSVHLLYTLGFQNRSLQLMSSTQREGECVNLRASKLISVSECGQRSVWIWFLSNLIESVWIWFLFLSQRNLILCTVLHMS